MGIPPKGAALYIQMYKPINAGVVAPLEPRSPENSTPTSFEEFVQDVFAHPSGERPPPATSETTRTAELFANAVPLPA
jgi:hypothetical protein